MIKVTLTKFRPLTAVFAPRVSDVIDFVHSHVGIGSQASVIPWDIDSLVIPTSTSLVDFSELPTIARELHLFAASSVSYAVVQVY